MSIAVQSKLNRLLQNGVYGGLYFSAWLGDEGYSPQLVKRYRESGWLEALAPGVSYRAGEKLSALAAVSSYDNQLSKNLRVAAHSALELFGFNHYVPMGKPVLMVTGDSVPSWMSSDKFDMTISSFKTDVFGYTLSMKIHRAEFDILASSPELAFMECLHLAPKRYAYMDLYLIMEQLTALDPDGVQRVLENTKSQKVKRMFMYMAEKAGHYWFDMLNTDAVGLTTSKLQLVKGGTFVKKYNITVPKELYDYE